MASILVVDDDPDLRDLLQEALSSAGHTVKVALDGREGLERIRVERPDLVLADVEMPDLSGPAMAWRMFVYDLGLDRVPILLISGILGLERVAQIVGTPYFLAKPFTLASLLDLVDRALAERTPPNPLLTSSHP